MADDRDAIDALRKHNEQLAQLLTPDGIGHLDRLVLLEFAVHAYVNGRISTYVSMLEDEDRLKRLLSDRIQAEFQGVDDSISEQISDDIIGFLKIPEAVKGVGKKIGSVANAYVKKTAGGIIGGDNDD
jgi:hypothetical protein